MRPAGKGERLRLTSETFVGEEDKKSGGELPHEIFQDDKSFRIDGLKKGDWRHLLFRNHEGRKKNLGRCYQAERKTDENGRRIQLRRPVRPLMEVMNGRRKKRSQGNGTIK